MAEEALIS